MRAMVMLAVLGMVGCGGTVAAVEPPDAHAVDAGAEAPIEDAAPDAPEELAPDTSSDAATEATPDASSDAPDDAPSCPTWCAWTDAGCIVPGKPDAACE